MTDIIIIGGGVIGLTTAYELAGQGVRVTVLEQGQFGREASWAGAGILPPGNPDIADNPPARLRGISDARWRSLSEELLSATGIDNGYRRCGGLAVQLPGIASSLDSERYGWESEGVAVLQMSPSELREVEPELNASVSAGFRLPELAQVRNPRHLKALVAGCAARGVELVAGAPVVEVDCEQMNVVSVRTPQQTYSAGQFCICGGAWSRQILQRVGCRAAIEPVRGQIVLLSVQPLPFRHVIEVGPRYLVPRPDGKVLIGATEERVGFDKRNTAGAISELIQFGCTVIPCLGEARFEQAWSGLRPASADGLPYLGRVPGLENLFVAAGHFRAGLQLSPGTALVLRQLMLGEEPAVPLAPFRIERGIPVQA